MSSSPAFWDSSALIPLCVSQPPVSSTVHRLAHSYAMVVWWGTPVEISSGIARLLRMGKITSVEYTAALRIANFYAAYWSDIQPQKELRSSAVTLTERYGLTAADALQLAASLYWCNDTPQGRVFLTADDRLRIAAQTCGFDVSHL